MQPKLAQPHPNQLPLPLETIPQSPRPLLAQTMEEELADPCGPHEVWETLSPLSQTRLHIAWSRILEEVLDEAR
jgi:hypothetical protein